ncbi:hypothetical protein ACDX34_08350 [Acinetobacter bereziniae]|uniref:hypothetical protein n=1 Tax=Acinetobacter bereziniae TaxID=106648 RepID=UPI0039C31CC7
MILKKIFKITGFAMIAMFLSTITIISGLKAGYSKEVVWIGSLLSFSQTILFLFLSEQLDSISTYLKDKADK